MKNYMDVLFATIIVIAACMAAIALFYAATVVIPILMIAGMIYLITFLLNEARNDE